MKAYKEIKTPFGGWYGYTELEGAAAADVKLKAARNEGECLLDVYKDWSQKKANAFDYCRGLCYALNGRDLHIVSHNTFIFTAAFDFEDPDTGVCKVMLITPSHNYAADI